MDGYSVLAMSVFTLTTIGCFLGLVALFDRDIDRSSMLIARARAIAPAAAKGASGSDARKQTVEELLASVDEGHARTRFKLRERIRQAGLNWTMKTYYLVCVGTGLACGLISLVLLRLPAPVASLLAFAGGVGLPRLLLEQKRTRRLQAFSNEFANAVDIIVRGVKSGLPLSDCLKIIGGESKEPVRSEFRQIVEDQSLGLPAIDAVQRLPLRMPTAEARFFSIVIAIQSRSGGSLSEALSNLSKVLRDRKKMDAKVRAVSAEAKASAAIIGSLPPAVAGLMYLTSPAYISILFRDPIGHLVLVACGVWMIVGVLVMRKMINFDF